MKIGPSADYFVQVAREEWEQETRPELYAGIFTVTLQSLVRVTFVPDLSAVAPPWTDAGLPADLDELTTVADARMVSVLSSPYSVTPNAGRAGAVETFAWPAGRPRVVRYVTPAEFDAFAAELDHLSRVVGGVRPKLTVGELRGYEVVRFLEREVVAAPWLRPADAAMLGREVSA